MVSKVGDWYDNVVDYSVHLYFRAVMPEIRNANPESPVDYMQKEAVGIYILHSM
jgi:hypothetical protein